MDDQDFTPIEEEFSSESTSSQLGVRQKLPNDPLAMILAILSIPMCCCWGIGIVPGIIAFVMARKGLTEYSTNSHLYDASSQKNMNTAKILAIVGMILGALYLVYIIVMIATGGMAAYQEQMRELLENAR